MEEPSTRGFERSKQHWGSSRGSSNAFAADVAPRTKSRLTTSDFINAGWFILSVPCDVLRLLFNSPRVGLNPESASHVRAKQ